MESNVFNQDCMLGLREIEDKFFDLAIVDPPYGVNLSGGRGNNGWTNKEFWDKAREGWNLNVPDASYFKELFRVSKNQIIWGGNYFILPPSQCWIIWDKGQRDFSLADGEMAWTSFDKRMRIFTYSRGRANGENKFHPTQKPTSLYQWLLCNYASLGDKILDTHMGSQSSRIAAYDMGFDYWGYEIDKDYFHAGCKRFGLFKSQLKLELA